MSRRCSTLRTGRRPPEPWRSLFARRGREDGPTCSRSRAAASQTRSSAKTGHARDGPAREALFATSCGRFCLAANTSDGKHWELSTAVPDLDAMELVTVDFAVTE
jgi:hypothetical protein